MVLRPVHVFVTGIAGFLGSHLADALLSAGHTVTGNDNLASGERAHVPASAIFHHVDCAALNELSEALKDVDVVVHTAAVPYQGLSVFSPAWTIQHNVGASAHVFSAAVQAGVRRVVFCSSMARYGAQLAPFSEELLPAPVDPYGIAKVASEALLRQLAAVHGFEWSIVVPHNIVGPRQRFDDPHRNVASIMANLMLQGRQPIIYGDGEQRRAFSPIDDCIESLLALVTGDDHGFVVNIGPDENEISVNALAALLADIIGFDLDPIYMPARPCEVHHATCSAQRARERLGYAPRKPLRASLEELVDYIRQSGPRAFRYTAPLEINSDLAPQTWREQIF